MNILMVGSGKGSFTMRGIQVGASLGARVTSAPTADDWRWADVVVLIKRAARTFAPDAHKAGVPIVWDALDFWRQPADNALSEQDARRLLHAEIAAIRPAITIGATEAMAEACDGVCVAHHSWAGLEPQPARERVSVVAYEGNVAYLGTWWNRLTETCRRRGWTFVVNPPDIRQVDVFVAFRDGPWDGFLCREWKSGVKVGNAIAAGRPIIGQATAAMRELSAPSSLVERGDELDAALDAWAPLSARAAAVDVCRLLAPDVRMSTITGRYVGALMRVGASCVA